jgi:hypothetical protein
MTAAHTVASKRVAMPLLKRENGAWVPVQPGDLAPDVLADIAAASEGTASARRIADHIASSEQQVDASEPAHQGGEQLQQAFEALRLSHWPATMREALQDPIRGRLLRMTAQRMQEASCRVASAPPRQGQAEASHAITQAMTTAARHPLRRWTDLKRAAAGDRDDD